MKYFYDTEFFEDSKNIELISIGIVRESDGETYYAVNADMPMDRIRQHDWLLRNVMNSIPVTPKTLLDKYIANPENHHPRPGVTTLQVDRTKSCVKPAWVIANEVRDFLAVGEKTELWAWYGAYDHVVLAQLFGRMIDLPAGIPMYTNDVRSLVDITGVDKLPQQQGGVHNALADALHVKTMYDHIMRSWER
ncbi:3'-5' exoribonuclease domain-containing protein [Glutamicibacter ardleyensis]|uniref:3'-5' exoribonuclease n=1 Tax=Glutamicibacter ardleyensis TaxID=225894 RepID=A0ABQ2DG32_9MICC|nr:3'-5' exoribonuclease [Glutamicibacter ardleyensis]GGJ56020.1 3'-5' exoribonuclease [Glutamicibacter ardleyensis]